MGMCMRSLCLVSYFVECNCTEPPFADDETLLPARIVVGDEDIRPKDDYCGKYPNRDIPNDEFPDDAWQVDAVFVNHYLNDADKLISRAMEAIYTEYGWGKPLEPDQLGERMKMFHWDILDLKDESVGQPEKYSKRGDRGNGGWTTKRSTQGLVRRLLHAMITSDTFTVVLGGHSAAVGQGYVHF